MRFIVIGLMFFVVFFKGVDDLMGMNDFFNVLQSFQVCQIVFVIYICSLCLILVEYDIYLNMKSFFKCFVREYVYDFRLCFSGLLGENEVWLILNIFLLIFKGLLICDFCCSNWM